MPTLGPIRSSHLASASPFRAIGNLVERPTPISAPIDLMPCDSAIGTSAGPIDPASSEPEASAVRVSA